MNNLSPPIQHLIQKYQEAFLAARPVEGVLTVHVDEIASKVASFYEKIRSVVDWKEEHLIRKTAIERVLKRKLISELPGFNLIANPKAEDIAEPLVLELIRGGYFPNDAIPQSRLKDIVQILKKYIYLFQNSPLSKNSFQKKRIQFYNWLSEIAACEIEEVLDPPLKESALILAMTNLMEKRIQVDLSLNISEEKKRIQTYIAVHRTLFHLDSSIISYHLLRYWFPEWSDLPQSALEQITGNIVLIWEKIEGELLSPLSNQFFKLCEKDDTLYLVLGDVLEEFVQNPLKILEQLSQTEILSDLIKRVYERRMSTLKSRLFRMAIYSTLSIFVASGFSLFVVEVPLAKFFYGKFSPMATAVDLSFPTILMFLIVASARLPKKSNLDKVISEVKKIVYQSETKDVYQIKKPKKRGFFLSFFVSFLYSLANLISLAITVLIFYLARVPITSVILDTVNVAVVVFAGLIIRDRAKELTVEKEKPNFWEFSLDVLSIPVAKMGKWVSDKWKEHNVVSVFLMALVDMPFQTFVGLVESWSTFLKERKAEIH